MYNLLLMSQFINNFGAGFGTLLLALFAYKGLIVWKEQIYADMKIKFLDELIGKIDEYMNVIFDPLQMLEIIEISISSYSYSSSKLKRN